MAIRLQLRPSDFRYCSSRTCPVMLTGGTIALDPIPGGKFITFNLSARTDRTIPGGELQIDLKYYGKHFHTKKYNLCDGVPCPVSVGDFVLIFSQAIPENVDQGIYNFELKLFGEDGNRLSHVAFDFAIQS